MTLELLIAGTHCPISGISIEDYTRIRSVRNTHPPGYYASDWEISNEKKEKQVRAKRKTDEERRIYNNEKNKRNYNPDKKHQYYLTRKLKLKNQ